MARMLFRQRSSMASSVQWVIGAPRLALDLSEVGNLYRQVLLFCTATPTNSMLCPLARFFRGMDPSNPSEFGFGEQHMPCQGLLCCSHCSNPLPTATFCCNHAAVVFRHACACHLLAVTRGIQVSIKEAAWNQRAFVFVQVNLGGPKIKEQCVKKPSSNRVRHARHH